ncbi:E3 ubiquitin-protein ligase BRE1-like 1 [Vitis vinifera]|uniref:E3 ubiquitin protein ligase n=1 Tax=Vitis vinifera TaxID=29760 RepID=A0A438C9Z3_VITVI|nr:E3 ubiquitin-protein ligase BRE1-like 1 [Vitis vinifera]
MYCFKLFVRWKLLLTGCFSQPAHRNGATESCSANDFSDRMEEDRPTSCGKTKNSLSNIVSTINDLWCLKDGLYAAVLEALPEDGLCNKKISGDLHAEVNNMRLAFGDLHLKHKSVTRDMQSHRDIDAKNKAELKRLRGKFITYNRGK